MQASQPSHRAGRSIWVGLIVILAMAGLARWYMTGGLNQRTAASMARIQAQMAQESAAQYQVLVRQQADAMAKCEQAGMTADAYGRVHDEAAYRKWKDQQEVDCTLAHAPHG